MAVDDQFTRRRGGGGVGWGDHQHAGVVVEDSHGVLVTPMARLCRLTSAGAPEHFLFKQFTYKLAARCAKKPEQRNCHNKTQDWATSNELCKKN